MGGHVLIVDADAGRRAGLRATLGLAEAEVGELDDPRDLAARVAALRPDLLLLDAEALPALAALRRAASRPADRLPAIALVPADRPELRLGALEAGADDATMRGTAAGLLRARVRSLLRQRGEEASLAPRDESGASIHGLAEAAANFDGPRPRARIGVIAVAPPGEGVSAEAVARLAGQPVQRLGSAAEARAGGFDLVLIDAGATRDDLRDGAQVLSLLAELQAGQPGGGGAATLVLLPESAVETAALSLDLGAGDVVAGPAAPEEVACRAQALLGRRRLREALRDQVRLGLRAAVTDPLTGLHNLRYAEAALARMGEAEPVALLMVDIDHFKRVNDTHGHAAGDRVLREVAQRLRAVLRPSDLLARVGGEEFLIALPGAGAQEAALVAERLRRSVAARPVALADGDAAPGFRRRSDVEAAVTVSVGVATGGPAGPAAMATRRAAADAALYEAKRRGRNAVAVAA